MNSTTKSLALLLIIVVGIGMVSAAPNQDCQNCPNGVAMNMIGCFELNRDVQAAANSAIHERYTDDEAVTAMGPEADDNALNHERYTDDEAVTAMGDEAHDNSLNHLRYTDAEAREAVGPTGLSGYEIVSVVVSGVAAGNVLIPNEPDFPPALPECPCGKVLIGGGGRMLTPGPSNLMPILVSAPEGRAWRVTWGSNLFQIFEYEVEVFAICVDEPEA